MADDGAHCFPYPFTRPPQSLPGPPPGRQRAVLQDGKDDDDLKGELPWLLAAKMKLKSRAPGSSLECSTFTRAATVAPLERDCAARPLAHGEPPQRANTLPPQRGGGSSSKAFIDYTQV
eukprot:GHVT01018987.1.p1 GENE.GHVT01018987.1~~GHVT01018987.1.p1  ORF type:complete len:119 (-),score=25.13 GHVT01018987.1:1321-1677(-)